MDIVKSIKFNLEEQEELKKILKKERFSTFVKSLIFNNTKYLNKLEINKEKAKNLNLKILELKRIGTNLNQIAKYANTNKRLDIFVIKELIRIRKALEKNKEG